MNRLAASLQETFDQVAANTYPSPRASFVLTIDRTKVPDKQQTWNSVMYRLCYVFPVYNDLYEREE